MTQKPRIHLIDEIRGLAIILMVFYHAFYLLGYQFGFELMSDAQKFFEPLQPPFACLFILISGYSSYLSRSNFKRGIRLLLIAFGFTAVTVLLLPKFGLTGTEIHFGILHLLSVSMLLFALLRKYLERIPEKIGIAVSLFLFILTYSVQNGKLLLLDLPDFLYANELTAVFGFTPIGYYSADYFPILPYVFMFLCGTFFGRYFDKNTLPRQFYTMHFAPLAKIGQKTLIIYIIHWPLIFLMGLIISKI